MDNKSQNPKKSNRFDVGQFNMQAMDALHKKYTRDYLGFFEELSTLYKIGKNKREIAETIQLIEKARNLLSGVINDGIIGVEDSEKLYDLVEKIEAKKQYFLEEVQKVKALQEKISEVTEKTGVSSQDLNVTQELVKEGVRQSRRKAREGIGSFLERTAPRTYGGIAKVGAGLGTSLLGPFTPLAKAGIGVGKDIIEWRRKATEEKERKLGESYRSGLRPSAAIREQTQEARGTPPPVGEFRGVSNRRATLAEQVAPLKEFFDKDAYKAKWTQELLKAAKEGRGGKGENVGGLGGAFPLLGKAAQVVGIGVAAVFAANRLQKLGEKIQEYSDVQKYVQKELREQAELQKRFNDELSLTLGQKLREAAKSGDEARRKDAVYKIKQLESERAHKQTEETGAWEDWKAGLGAIIPDEPTSRAGKMATPLSGLNGSVNSRSEKGRSFEVPSVPGLDILNETIKRLTDQLQKNQTPPILMSGSGGNMFDSADALINAHANGGLTLGK